MLVLSRKESQRIRLGDSIVITVVHLGGDKVRLGIEAPKEMLVLRDELEAFSAMTTASDAADILKFIVFYNHSQYYRGGS